MGEKNFTLLALHFDDVQIGPKTKVESEDGSEATGEGSTLPAPSGGGRALPVGRKTVLAGLLGVGLLGGLAVAAKLLLGGEEDGLDLEDPTADEEFESTELED